jgi:hydroxymethylglutaryl-CoA synthase
MSASKGIVACGAYVPRLRLQRASVIEAIGWFNPGLRALGVGERAIARWDEDAITMAVEAARDCVGAIGREVISKLVMASTSLPFADRQNAVLIKEALNLRDDIGALDISGSQRAGTSALSVALEGADGGGVLCVASERRPVRPGSEAELINGDAAAAFVVGTDNVIAEFVGSHSTSVDFVDRFRVPGGAYDYEWETRWIRDEGYRKLLPAAILATLRKLELDPKDVDHLIVPLPFAGSEVPIARATGIAEAALRDCLQASLGYAGCAHPLVLLADLLSTAQPGALIIVTSFGQGCDVLVFRTTRLVTQRSGGLGVRGWLARRKTESNYVRHLSFAGMLELDGGMRSEVDLRVPSSLLYRERKAILALVAGRCRVTGAVQYPKSGIAATEEARTIDTQDDYPLADRRARVVTFTSDWLGFSPEPPNSYGLVEFEGGGRMMVDFTDLDPELLEVGQWVRMMFRLKRQDSRGFRHYFWKATSDYRAPER